MVIFDTFIIKVLWVHRYMPIGNEAEIMIYDDNMRMLEKRYDNDTQKMNDSLYAQLLLD